MTEQWNGALGNGAETIIKQQREAVAKEHGDSTGGGPHGHEHDNAPHNRRNVSAARQNPPESTPDNADFEDSYSPEKISLRFKEDVLRMLKENPKLSYDDAVGAVGSKWHSLEREVKAAGASRRFAP